MKSQTSIKDVIFSPFQMATERVGGISGSRDHTVL